MTVPLTKIEQLADDATKLHAFPVNLHKIRGSVEKVLNEWKSGGFFTEYTDHSFSHVIDMLETAEWIIPEETKGELTPADWILIVLSIYFHDIGLLVTKAEYENRKRDPDFKSFLENPVIPSEKYAQFKAKLDLLSEDEADRLRFQEYVRYTHGKRVKSWLEGTHVNDDLSPMRKIIEELVKPLDSTIRRDLALICESHTLNNIDNTSVFKISQPYGGARETANLQYCAVILRTVDLLQITQRRAPGVLYQMINPGDPLSQVEWQKQSAVRSVRPALGRDRDGNVSEKVLSDTIEVHATFKEPNGFFGLTSYLAYAEKELQQSYAAIQKSSKNVLKKYLFPWRAIDTNSIDTEGFLTDSFEFELDQHKILDLLTGHTLYNDTTVVLRELTQNALDAVRLQCEIEKVSSSEFGEVHIWWNEKDRALTIADNGTGMSQEVIENHLLKVGSSRYQDAKFKEKHPDFHSISRFGIGVLSAFMVSDDVEITTCSEDDNEARRIALRSVHGKYLIKLLDKQTDRSQLPMYPHGTSVRMILRPTAVIGDILRVAKSWLMFPRCKVHVHIDDRPAVGIGFSSPAEALQNYLNSTAIRSSRYRKEYEVKQFEEGGVTLAFAIVKDELFQDWGFVDVPQSGNIAEDEDFLPPVGTCVEGVAVEADSPGFRGRSILAVANAVGPSAPKTNVARSALEDTAEQREMLESIYALYSRHISDEIARLATSGTHSLSRAVGVGPFIATPLLGNQSVKPALLADAMAKVPLVLVEGVKDRKNVSFLELSEEEEFWTIESPLFRSIEYFVKEAPTDVTANKILSTLGNKTSSSSSGLKVCNVTSRYVEEKIDDAFEISEVVASSELRQLEFKWSKKLTARRWLTSQDVYSQVVQRDRKYWRLIVEFRERNRQNRGGYAGESINIPRGDAKIIGLNSVGSFAAYRKRYVNVGVPLAGYFLSLGSLENDEQLRHLAANFLVVEAYRYWGSATPGSLERALNSLNGLWVKNHLNLQALSEAMSATGSEIFDPFAWDRRGYAEPFASEWGDL